VDFVYGSACTCRGGCESLLVLAGSTPAASGERPRAPSRKKDKRGPEEESEHDGRQKRKKHKKHERKQGDKKRGKKHED
jgi:hypothetical protein